MDSPMSIGNGIPHPDQRGMAMDPTQMDYQSILGPWPQQMSIPMNSPSSGLSSGTQSHLSPNMGLRQQHPNQNHHQSQVQNLGMDSREWLLSDSARLHQSFGPYNVRQHQQADLGANSIFIFGANGSADGGGEQYGDLSSFDSLAASLTALNAWMPSGME